MNTKAIETTITINTLSIEDPNNGLQLAFGNGENLSLQIGDLSEAIILQAALHGLKQKLGDAAAMSRDPVTGRSATIDDKFDAVKAVYDRLLSGQWNAVREGGSGKSKGGLLFAALCKMYEGAKTPAQIQAYLEGKSDQEKAALRKNAKVAAIIAEIRAASTGDDGSDLLDELDTI